MNKGVVFGIIIAIIIIGTISACSIIIQNSNTDEIIPQAQALKDMSIKVKYRMHSELITVSSE